MRIRLMLMLGLVAMSAAGCANWVASSDAGNEIRIREEAKPSAGAKREKYPITVRIAGYVDGRDVDSPRRLGVTNTRIFGITGNAIMLDRNVTDVVAESVKRYMDKDGLQVQTGEGASAQFQLNGSVKQLSIDVKERDYVNIAVESTLTEVGSGKVIWSGVVVQKSERYAGVSGNSKKDIADLLSKELGIAMGKTSESILSVLMSSRPDLFNMGAGMKPVQGVTVLSTAVAAPPVAAPSADQAGGAGTLVLNSLPARAKVYVDGVYFGLTPLRAEIAAGIHEVTLKSDGYQNAAEKVSVRKGDSTELEVKLQR